MKSIKEVTKQILCVITVVLTLIVILKHKSFMLRKEESLPVNQTKELSVLGSKAIPSLDVPVASLLLYKNEIIGRGYNTVNADTNITAHAEINAINEALKKYGFEAFKKLNRDSLVLITTFEPCAMCRSVIISCGIKEVKFIQEKSLAQWWKEDLKEVRYEWRKRQAGPKSLQDSLFRLHPKYNP